MIVSETVNPFAVAWALRLPLLGVAISSAIAVMQSLYFESQAFSVGTITVTILGGTLGVFLAFRNTEAYGRYWEARTLWGRLVNSSRDLTRQVLAFIDAGPTADRPVREELRAFQRDLLLRQLGVVNALRTYLREEDQDAAVREVLPENEVERLKGRAPLHAALLHDMGLRLRDAWQRGWLDEIRWATMERTLRDVSEVVGGCERIKNTPLPPGYTYFSHRLISAYCLLLPFGLVKDLGNSTPLVALLISFAFLVLDQNGSHVETPFGCHANDLALSSMSRTIEIHVREMLGDEAIPEPVQPVDGILL